MKKALVVDDVELNRDILTDILSEEFEIIQAENGEEAIEIIEKHIDELSVMLLDLIMPKLDGFGVLEVMQKNGWINRLPVLVVTGETDSELELKCLELGVADFITKPFNEILVKRRIANTVDLYSYKNHLEDEVALQLEEIKEQNKKLTSLNEGIIQMLGEIIELRSHESGLHIKRVKEFTKIIAKDVQKRYPEYNLSNDDVRVICIASPMHDIGKIMIPDAILNKTSKLTEEEFEEMKKHTIYGCEVIKRAKGLIPDRYLNICSEICMNHHERVDGKGYPHGLKGEEVPISAQVVSLADVYDALVTERSYKKAYPPEDAYEMIISGQCGQFSEKMLQTLQACKEKMGEML